MRMTIHNGRAGKNGAYNPRHNDRNFDISHAEHIDPERMPGNIYWNWTGKNISFEDAEKEFYELHCREYLDAVNRRHREQRHPERMRDMDAYRTARQTCPEETLFMIGNRNEHLPPKTLRAICEDLRNWEENTVSGLKVLNIALHVDEEGAPHIHMRKAWIYRDENNVELISQSKALQAAGMPLPHPDKPAGRHNNRKQTFSQMERKALYEICRGYGLESLLETKPREKSKSGRELEDYKASEAEKRAAEADRRRQFSERAAESAEKQAESAKDTARSYEEHAEQVARQINDEYGELADAGLQKQAMQEQLEEVQERLEHIQEQLEYARADYKKAYQKCQRAERRAAALQNILTAAERRQVEQIRQEQEQEQKQFEEDEWPEH